MSMYLGHVSYDLRRLGLVSNDDLVDSRSFNTELYEELDGACEVEACGKAEKRTLKCGKVEAECRKVEAHRSGGM